MNLGRVIRGRVEYQVDYQILGKFLSKTVEFQLVSGEKKI